MGMNYLFLLNPTHYEKAFENFWCSDFCSNCGSPVPNETKNGEKYWVPAGLLDEPLETSIAVHVFVDSTASWDTAFISDSVPKYSEMPETQEFMQLLHCKYE